MIQDPTVKAQELIDLLTKEGYGGREEVLIVIAEMKAMEEDLEYIVYWDAAMKLADKL